MSGGLWLEELIASEEWENVKFIGMDVGFCESTIKELGNHAIAKE